MQITDVRVRKVSKEGKLKAVVSITIDDEFVVHDIKVIEGEKGLFIAMLSHTRSIPVQERGFSLRYFQSMRNHWKRKNRSWSMRCRRERKDTRTVKNGKSEYGKVTGLPPMRQPSLLSRAVRMSSLCRLQDA